MMPNRQVTFLINANAKAFKSGLKSAQSTFRKIGRNMERTGRKLTRNVSAPLVAMGGLAVKAAGDFEDSFANIRKTVDTTEQQFGKISEGMRDLAKTVPTSVNELNRLGGVAGQLGIEADNIVGFTETLAMLADTTDVVGEEGALKLARFMNVMGTAQQDIGRLGSTVAGLGNNFAAMESEIVEMATAMAPLGNSIGLTEQQVLAFSGTIAASGGELKAAGTAFQKTANTMKQAVIEGNDTLDLFAETSGMSASAFQKAFQEDAAGALQSFLEGLRRVQEEGGSTAMVLEEVGLADQRLIREFGKVLGNLDDLNKALPAANTYWEENTALTEEAQKRYETFNSRVQILWNNLKDLGITIGNTLMPVVDKLINASQKAINFISNMSEESRLLGLKIAGIAIVAGPTLIFLSKLALGISALMSPTFLAQAALTTFFVGVVTSGQWMVDNWEKIVTAFEGHMLALQQSFTMATMGIIRTIKKFVNFATQMAPPELLTGIFGIDLSEIAFDVAGVNDLLNDLESNVESTGKAMQKKTKEYFEKPWTSFGESAFSALQKAKNAIINGLKGILNSEEIQSLISQIEQMTSAPAQGGGQTGKDGSEQKNIESADPPSIGFNLGAQQAITNMDSYMAKLSELPSAYEAVTSASEKFDIGLQSVSSRAQQMGFAISSGINQASGQFLEGIGQMMAGTQNFGGVMNNVLQTLADLAVRVGKIAIAVGVGIEGIRQALASLNPVAAIAAGVALVALGAWAKSSLQQAAEDEAETGSQRPRGMAMGGIVPSGFPNDTYPAMLTSGEMVVPKPHALPSNMGGGRKQVIENVVNLDGKEIYRNQKEVNRKINR